MLRTAWVGVLLVGATAAPAFGQVKLEWKFNEGDKFYVEDVSTLKNKIGFMGKEYDQTTKVTMVTSYKVDKKTSDSTVLTSKIENVEVKSMAGLGESLDKMLEKLKGAVMKITLDKNNKITKFEGYEDFIGKLTAGDEETGKIIKKIITEDTLKQSSDQMFAFLPPNPVSKGDTWKHDAKVPFGGMGEFKASQEYTYLGKEAAGEKVALKGSLTYLPPKGDSTFGLFKIVRGNLKAEGAKGTMFFDAAKGRPIRYSMAMVMRGTLTLDIVGMMTDMELTMDQSSTSRVLNRNPLEKEQ
jgi:hypothetical protein